MNILVPVDGSGHALDAVRHALHRVHEGLQAAFVLTTVQEPTCMYEMVLAPDAEVLERVTGAVGGRALEGAGALFDLAGVPFAREIGTGEPAATLIVMGARGLGPRGNARPFFVAAPTRPAPMRPSTVRTARTGLQSLAKPASAKRWASCVTALVRALRAWRRDRPADGLGSRHDALAPSMPANTLSSVSG